MHQQHTQDTEHMRETFLSGRQQEAVLRQSCRTELWQSSHFDLQSAHFGDRRKLNPIGSIAGTLVHSTFFIRGISKLCVKEALWLICRFCLFGTSPVELGENERSWRHWNGCYACKRRHECMHVVGFWHRKALARCWVDPQELVWHGNHTVHRISFYSHWVPV